MSLSRTLQNDLPPSQDAPRAPQTEERSGNKLTIGGGEETTEKKRPHVRLDHAIHHHLELNTESHQLKYQTDGVINPGKHSRFVVRAPDTTLSITLEAPPLVPAEQRTPAGARRYREWSAEVSIYYVQACTVTWPTTDVIWPTTTDPVTGNELPGAPPENTRAAGTSDRFFIRYSERTGEWWILTMFEGVATNDPETPIDPEEEEEEDPNEDTAEPGNPGPGSKMPEKDGVIFALNPSGYSVSPDCGYSWSYYDTASSGHTDFAVVGEDLAILAGDEVFTGRSGLLNFQKVKFETDEIIEYPLDNPNFETGDTTGWFVAPEGSATVLETVQPPQRPGSTFYLARDDGFDETLEWNVSQVVSEIVFDKYVIVSADVYRPSGSTAQVRIVSDVENPAELLARPNGTNSFSGNTCADFATAPDGQLLDLVSLNGQKAGIDGQSSGSNLFYRLQLRYKNGDPYDGPWFMPMGNLNPNREWMDVDNNLFENYIIAPGDSAATPAPAGEPNRTRFYSNNGGILDMGLVCGQATIEFDLRTIGGAFDITQDLTETGDYAYPPQTTTVTVLEPEFDGEWETVQAAVVFQNSASAQITLRGVGDAYFDNVRITRPKVTDEPAHCLTRKITKAQKSYIIGCEENVYEVLPVEPPERSAAFGTPKPDSDQNPVAKKLFEPPISPRKIATLGANYLIANGADVALTRDDGESWNTATMPANVAQLMMIKSTATEIPPAIQGLINGLGGITAITDTILEATGNGDVQIQSTAQFADPIFIGVLLENGEIRKLKKEGPGLSFQMVGSVPAGSYITRDERRKCWVAVADDGTVRRSTTQSDTVIGFETVLTSDTVLGTTTGDRQILATDIGRWISWREGETGQAWTEKPEGPWTDSVDLSNNVITMQESK